MLSDYFIDAFIIIENIKYLKIMCIIFFLWLTNSAINLILFGFTYIKIIKLYFHIISSKDIIKKC